MKHAPSLSFARYARSLAVAGSHDGAAAFARGQQWAHDGQLIATALKAASNPLGRDSMGDAALSKISTDFAAFLRPKTIIGRLPMQRGPLRTRIVAANAGMTGGFVSEAQAAPVMQMSLESAAFLKGKKVASAAVVSRELAQSADPSADEIIATDLAAGVSAGMDAAFADPTNTGSDDVPASVFFGATEIASTGSTVSAIDNDLRALVQALITAGTSASHFVMSETTRNFLLSLRSGGVRAFPELLDGRLLDLPALASAAIEHAGSPGRALLGVVDAQQLLLADDGAAEISLSTAGAVQLNTTPSAGAQQLVSMWQSGLVGFMATRFCDWSPRRSGAAAFMLVDF